MLKPSVTDDQPAEPKTIPQFRDVIAGMTKSVFMKINPAATQLAATLCIFASLVWVLGASGQSTRRPTISAYINPGAVAAPARSFLFAFGDRIRRPGKERATLMGKYTDRSGAVDFRLVWEVPGRLRFDRSDKPGRPIIYDEVIGWNNAAAIARGWCARKPFRRQSGIVFLRNGARRRPSVPRQPLSRRSWEDSELQGPLV